jgi:Zn-dependent protease with chaperone function
MEPALLVFGYALAVAWYLPVLLARLTARGVSARLGLAAWLTAMVSALASMAAALQFLVRAAMAGWPRLAEAVCRSVAGGACAPGIYRNAIFELALGIGAIVAALTACVLAWRYGRSVQQAQRRTRAHAEAARITGRRLPGAGWCRPCNGTGGSRPGPAAVVLDAPQPVAYCVAGRPATIVLTSAALAVLDPAQLTAVLAHERAHLAGRHHLLIALTRALAASFPAVPLFTRGPQEVARLAEMCADDAAARHSGRPTLIAALLAMGTGAAVPAAGLAATGCAITARVQRLLEPPCRARHARYRLALIAVIILLALVSGLVTTFATVIAAHGIAAA